VVRGKRIRWREYDMSLETIEGIYRDGAVKLKEQPKDTAEAEVLVTFLSTSESGRRQPLEPRMMRFGMFAGDGVTNDEDFANAEWRGATEVDG
jgi:hypothetical protein